MASAGAPLEAEQHERPAAVAGPDLLQAPLESHVDPIERAR